MIRVDTNCVEILPSTPKEPDDAAIVVHWNVEMYSLPLSKWSITSSVGDKRKRRYNFF
jgi:hypothetical protein